MIVVGEGILRCAQDERGLRGDCHEPIGSRNDGVSHHSRNDAHTNNVILNEVKNLKASETVDGSANLEMHTFAQHDKTQRGDPSLRSG